MAPSTWRLPVPGNIFRWDFPFFRLSLMTLNFYGNGISSKFQETSWEISWVSSTPPQKIGENDLPPPPLWMFLTYSLILNPSLIIMMGHTLLILLMSNHRFARYSINTYFNWNCDKPFIINNIHQMQIYLKSANPTKIWHATSVPTKLVLVLSQKACCMVCVHISCGNTERLLQKVFLQAFWEYCSH